MASITNSISAKTLPQFDELYVISDLHLGGGSGFQIFNSANELVRLINHLRSTLPSTKKIALLINGDFIDFLAESPSVHFDPANAVEKLSRIAKEDRVFSQIFESLRKFTATKNRFLIVNLGNHDLELALPWVKNCFLELLSGQNDAARGKITLSFDGAGYLCNIGNAKVLCVHGNEVDDWNLTNHEAIRRIGRDVVQGRPIDTWIPNAGTQLVIDVMNDIKRRYPFVDLLKPEMPAVIPTLLALAPEQSNKIRAIGATAGRLVLDKFRRAIGFLGNDELKKEVNSLIASPLIDLPEIGPLEKADFPENDRKKFAQTLLQETEQRINRNEQPLTLIESDHHEEYLGKIGAIRNYINGDERSEVLREALENLRKDRSFDPAYEDETFNSLDSKIGGEIDFLIAGHTHLERALKRKRERGWYFNSGTWIRLIKLEEEVLNDRGKFNKVFKAFEAGTMDALDSHPGLVRRILTVVAIKSENSTTSGELLHVNSDPESDLFSTVPRSLFSKK